MADKSDHLAAIDSKKCKGTGITPELARTLFNNPGKHIMAIVELGVGDRVIKPDGQEVVHLVLTTIEPVIAKGKVGREIDEHARLLQQALYRNRALAEGQEELPLDGDDGPAPRPADVIAQGKALIETGPDGKPAGLYDPDAEPTPGGTVTPIESTARKR